MELVKINSVLSDMQMQPMQFLYQVKSNAYMVSALKW